MRVLIACEMSGRVRDAFIAKGHDAMSCDLLPSETPGPHYQGDVRYLLAENWDLIVGFPPCTDLAASNAHNLKVKEEDGRMADAANFFMYMYYANSPRVCIENPVGVMSRLFRKPDQIIDPWMFGDPYNKRTCLWLRGLDPLVPTHTREDYDEEIVPWHHGSGIQRNGVRTFGKHAKAYGAKNRSLTFPGVAKAMAEQWG